MSAPAPATASPGVDTEEQAALRQSVASLLEKKSDSAAVRAAFASADGYDPALWSTLVDQIGAAALSVPEDFDGAGATWVETHLVCEELGRRLTPSPMLGSAVLAAQAVLASGDEAACARLLPGIAAGELAALCWADRDSRVLTPLWRTADFGYLRMHSGLASPRPAYGPRAIDSWLDRLRAAFDSSDDVFVYFNNDTGGAAVDNAIIMARRAS